jgi:cellulose biosynthesis protein BcsQ
MSQRASIASSIERLDAANRKHAKQTDPEHLRQLWATVQQRGKIVIIDSPGPGDKDETRTAIIVSTDAGLLIRVELTKTEGVNLSRAIVDSVT